MSNILSVHEARVRAFNRTTKIATVIMPGLYGMEPIEAAPFMPREWTTAQVRDLLVGDRVLVTHSENEPPEWLDAFAVDTVKVTGDVMSGNLKVIAPSSPTLTLGNSDDQIRMTRTASDVYAYHSYYWGVDANGVGGTRQGWIGLASSGNISIIADFEDVFLQAGPSKTVRSTDKFYATGQSRFYHSTGPQVSLLGTGDYAHLAFFGGGSNVDTPGTRDAWIGRAGSTVFWMKTDSGQIAIGTGTATPIDFYNNDAYSGRFDASGNFLVNKTVLDSTTTGASLSAGGRLYVTVLAVNHYNIVSNIPAAGDNDIHCHFRRSDVGVGSINMTAALTGVDYTTSCDRDMKDEIEDIGDDEAMDFVESWRPRKFRWRYDKDGEPSPHGRPGGDVIHSFVAQEMFEVAPRTVTPGRGKWEDHLKWRQRKEAARKARETGDEVEEFDETVGPYEPWSMDFSKLVPDLAAAVRGLIRSYRRDIAELREEVASLRTQIANN